MRVLVFSSYYLPGYKGGGPIKTISNLIQQLGDKIEFKVITNNRDLGDSKPYKNIQYGTWTYIGDTAVLYNRPGILGYHKTISTLVFEDYDIIYLNSFFSPHFSIFPLLVAKLLGRNIVLAPRGEFSQGALDLKPKKKKIFIALFKYLGLYKDLIFQASTEYEAADIRRVFGDIVDIKVAENLSTKKFTNNLAKRTGSLKLVFISRISAKKNLLTAIKILKNIKVPLQYHIYGPIEDKEYWSQCKKSISELPANIKVKYKGELKPRQVVDTLSEYDLFFFPTTGENYGHVIAEALCAGLPLLISDTTPWRALEGKGIGRDVNLHNLETFRDAISFYAQLSSQEYAQTRNHVLNWAKRKFSQRDAIEANIAMFRYAYNKNKGTNNVVQK